MVEKGQDTAIVAIAGVQRIAQWVELGEIVHASLQLRALHSLLQRSGKTDRQCEELGEFIEKTKDLDRELRDTVKKIKIKEKSDETKKEKSSKKEKEKGKEEKEMEMSDSMAEAVHRAKAANKALYLSGERKKEMCVKRRGDEALNKEYYSYVF